MEPSQLKGIKSPRVKEELLSRFSFHDPVDRYSTIDSSVSEKYKWRHHKSTKIEEPEKKVPNLPYLRTDQSISSPFSETEDDQAEARYR